MQSNVLKITKRQATVLLPGNNSSNFFQVLRFDAPKVFARQRLRPGQAMGHCKLQPLQTHLQMVVAKGQRKLDGRRYRQDLTGCNSCFQPRGSINFHVMKFPSISMVLPSGLARIAELGLQRCHPRKRQGNYLRHASHEPQEHAPTLVEKTPGMRAQTGFNSYLNNSLSSCGACVNLGNQMQTIKISVK